MKNYRMELSYDGTRYQGWQRLRQGETIQGKIEQVLSRILEQNVEISGSGRTDGGVHAKGQVANFHANTNMTVEQITKQLRHYLPGDIGLLSLEEADARFHARLSATSKTYVYTIWNGPCVDVFRRKYLWHLPADLNLEAMTEASRAFLGRHDFRSFCANPHMKKSTLRTITGCDVEKDGEEIKITVTGDGFLHHMVRILVGTLVEVGLGRREVAEMDGLLRGGPRSLAGETAPASGLCLWQVDYE